jgi:RNA polymerase sigma-70 factor (ECF subfamily)
LNLPRESPEFAEVFRAHASFVWRVLRRLGVRDADLDDALQEVFLVVHRKLADYQERGSVRAWLFTIARQTASHSRRLESRRQRRLSLPPMGNPPADPHESAMRKQAAQLVEGFLAQLDEPRALVFSLVEIEGMTVPEVATSLGENLNTLYARLRTARQQFEDFIEKRSTRA